MILATSSVVLPSAGTSPTNGNAIAPAALTVYSALSAVHSWYSPFPTRHSTTLMRSLSWGPRRYGSDHVGDIDAIITAATRQATRVMCTPGRPTAGLRRTRERELHNIKTS